MITSLKEKVRHLTAAAANEVYLTLTPEPGSMPPLQAAELYAAVRQTLQAAGARIFAERIFGTRDAIAAAEAPRRAALADLHD